MGLAFEALASPSPSQTPSSELELRVGTGVGGPDIPSLAPYRQQ